MPVLGSGDHQGHSLELNAYVLDYFAHGQKDALVRGNGLLEGDAFEGLKNFVLVLRTIATALGKLGPGEMEGLDDPVIVAFGRLAEEYLGKFHNFNG
jgi:hypothetical protein